MKSHQTDRPLVVLAAVAAIFLSSCGYGKPSSPASSSGMADSAASAAVTMPPPATAGSAPSAP